MFQVSAYGQGGVVRGDEHDAPIIYAQLTRFNIIKNIMRRSHLLPIFLMLANLAGANPAVAAEALAAVASNFSDVAMTLKAEFEANSPHEIGIVTGSTGKLYAQIVNGGPFDVLLAADQERPRLLEISGDAVAGSRFTYAIGQLVLWSPQAAIIGADIASTLGQPRVRKIAIANPALAPYGSAARETLQSLGVWEDARANIVMGENVGQAYALVATGNADLGFVAMSQVLTAPQRGQYIAVPSTSHQAVRQDAVLLRHGAGNEAARAFLDFLREQPARRLIAASGYLTE